MSDIGTNSPHPQGVKLAAIEALLEQATARGYSTTTEVCNGFVKPLTESNQCAYIETIDASFVGPATCFISHAWKYDLADSVDVMRQVEAEKPNTLFWFDLVINNQHGTSERPFEWWCSTFQNGVEQIGTVVLVLAPWTNPIPLTRSWCLFEIMCSFNAGVDLQVRMPTHQQAAFINGLSRDYDVALQALLGVKTEESEAWIMQDQQNIFRAVEASIGFKSLNSRINDRMRTWFLQQALRGIALIEGRGEDLLSDLGFANLCFNVATMLTRDYGKYDDALLLFSKALIIMRHVFGEQHATIANTYSNIGEVLRNKGDFDKALEQQQKALRIRLDLFGEQHPDTAHSFHGMGDTYRCRGNQGDYSTAFTLLSKALQIRVATLGDDHPSTAKTYIALGDVCDEQQEYSRAIEYLAKALAIQERVIGQEHPDMALSYNNIGEVYRKMDELDKALECYEKALASTTTVLGEGHPNVAGIYNNMAIVHEKQGNVQRAAECMQQALNIYKEVFGDHPTTAATLDNVATILGRANQFYQSLQNFEEALRIRKKIFGEHHPVTANTYSDAAVVLQAMGDRKRSIELYEKALVGFATSLGEHHPQTLETQRALSTLKLLEQAALQAQQFQSASPFSSQQQPNDEQTQLSESQREPQSLPVTIPDRHSQQASCPPTPPPSHPVAALATLAQAEVVHTSQCCIIT
eukprot:m.245076 g.245076  ORF g.245076 m.245076 type:complete len:694 (+) comp15357_c3_seq2:259-2340(+)